MRELILELKDAINARRSIRAFTAEPVPQDILREVLRLGTRAVSAVNAQPWEFAVITGDCLDAIRRDNIDFLLCGVQEDYPEPPIEGIYRERSKEIGKQLFAAMEIARGDREHRDWWTQRGYRFFDAPVGIVVFMDKALDEKAFRLDIGCVIQNICLAAMEYDLGTCVEYQPIIYQRGLRNHLSISESKRFICGIAIGYPDWEFPANQVASTRVGVDDITAWYGF